MSNLIRPPGTGVTPPTSRISPPTSPSHSVAAVLGRPIAGKAGIYRKTQAGVIVRADATVLQASTSYPFFFGVRCPSARVRVAMGISAHHGPFNVDLVTLSFAYFGPTSYWNIVPAVSVKDSKEEGNDGADNTEYLYGRALFDGSGYLNNSLEHISPYLPPSGGRALPDSYEAISMAEYYRCYGALARDTTAFGSTHTLPKRTWAWAAWEIIDPRNAEDSEALLAQCSLDLGQPTLIPS